MTISIIIVLIIINNHFFFPLADFFGATDFDFLSFFCFLWHTDFLWPTDLNLTYLYCPAVLLLNFSSLILILIPLLIQLLILSSLVVSPVYITPPPLTPWSHIAYSYSALYFFCASVQLSYSYPIFFFRSALSILDFLASKQTWLGCHLCIEI